MKRHDGAIRWFGFVALGMLFAAISGRLIAHSVNDTPSYLEYPLGSLDGMMLSIRTPGYPILLRLIEFTVGLSNVPAVHVLLHATACWALMEELMGRKMPMRNAVAVAFCVLVGCTAMDNISTISTDAPAASLGVLTVVLLMRFSRKRSSRALVGCGVLALSAILFRPAYLFLLPWIAIAGWLLAAHDGLPGRSRFGPAVVSSVIVVLLAGWMVTRKVVVNEFGLVPFGHQNLSAILVQTVPLDMLRSLEGDGGELAHRVSDELERQGYQSPTADSGLPTLTIESQWDPINYEVILPIANELENSNTDSNDALVIRVHARVSDMNRQLLSQSKLGYIRWIVLAVRRSVWAVAANTVMHPLFLAAILFGALWLLVQCVRGVFVGPIVVPAGWSSFAIVAITYAVMKIGFVILSSPPLGRFADAGAIFVPGAIACLLVGVGRSSKSNQQAATDSEH